MNSTLEVGKQLVALVTQGKWQEAIDQFYSPDIVSEEVQPGEMRTLRGLPAIQQKVEWWEKNFEVHGVKVEGPFPNDDEFILFYDMDVTDREKDHRFSLREAGVYTVKDGKIVREKFYYETE